MRDYRWRKKLAKQTDQFLEGKPLRVDRRVTKAHAPHKLPARRRKGGAK